MCGSMKNKQGKKIARRLTNKRVGKRNTFIFSRCGESSVPAASLGCNIRLLLPIGRPSCWGGPAGGVHIGCAFEAVGEPTNWVYTLT